MGLKFKFLGPTGMSEQSLLAADLKESKSESKIVRLLSSTYKAV